MENRFKRLSNPMNENTKLVILLRNLNPFYVEKSGLIDIESIEHLMRSGRNLELCRAMMGSYHLSSHKKTDLEPDLACNNRFVQYG